MKSLILFCLSLYVALAKHEVYDGYVLYEVYPNDLTDVRILNDIVRELQLDIWSYANLVTPGQIFVPGPKKVFFENAFKAVGIPYKASIENVRELLELEDQKLAAAASKKNGDSYRNLDLDIIYNFTQVTEYLADISQKYPDRTRLVTAGHSFEGRPIQYLEISTTGFQDVEKPVIFLQSLLHAREWVTLPTTLYAIHKLVVDVTESDVLNNIDWVIMPVANPDGYIWSQTNARFWRKNRRTGLMAGNVCMGVDLNRNFDIDWGTASSNNVCSDTFHGREPTSEPETQAVVSVLNKYRNRMAMYNDIHSYGSMILYGWGNGTLAPNALMLNVGGVRMAQAIDRVKWPSKPNYRVGNSVDILRYTDSGGSTDFASSIGIPYSYTFELPGLLGASGNNGFLVDPNFIRQSAIETWEGLVAGAKLLF